MLCHPKLKNYCEKEQGEIEKCIQELGKVHKKTNKNILKSLSQHRQTLNDLLTHKAEGAL